MTSASALTPQRAHELGRALAHRLVPLSQESGGLAEAACLALLSLLPTWLPPGEEGTAAALRQLVRDDRFAAYLLAPAAAEAHDPSGEALQRHLGQSVAAPLQPLLLLFSQGCREALRDLPASPVPPAAVAPPSERIAHAPGTAPARAGGIGVALSFALAAGACFAMGWLGYQLVTALRQPPAGPDVLGLLTPPASRGRPSPGPGSGPAASLATQAVPAQRPRSGQGARLASLQCLAGGQSESSAPADPSNYGPRLAQDWQGRPVPNTPALIVLHETVVDEATALNLFRRPHSEDSQQASYHVLIGRDGRRLRLVADEQRAFGAGDSAFEGLAVQLKPGLRPSVNNVALHVSLVSPADGADGEAARHSGYTPEQYRSLASQIGLWQARWGIPGSRVVTHQEVDRSGSRRDPRSFDWASLSRDLHQQWLACGQASPLADLRR